MFRKVLVVGDVPRSVADFNAAFSEGLGVEKWLSYIFLIAAVLLLAFVIIKISSWPTVVILIGIGVAAYLNTKKIARIENERKHIYINGKHVTGTVVDTFRKRVFYKSEKNYYLKVELNDGSDKTIIIEDNTEELWKAAPIGSEILGLEFEGKYLFGEMMNCKFSFTT